jgi:two-component system cell cycle sensor histidine kinase/response regulator CckA
MLLHKGINSVMPDTRAGSKQILLAEDEPGVRNLLQRLLHAWGYRVFPARNGREAMEISDEHKGEIDLLVSDVTMPEMDGPELAQRLKSKRPRLRVILLSGYSHTRIVLQRGWKFIQKPFQPQELKAAIEDSLKPEGDLLLSQVDRRERPADNPKPKSLLL